ncbi:DNA helicase-2/ATP-dependent DNA helicase PcrA [Scopulibacillus daqui]|uniref:DNA helicase-2/ATP-dependent DNA helicase PcrA n=1 Tax=Scopulibacillus daqui TaxID=1469162 RepID=A0ABS2PUT1_9BACL|nr:RNA polymerase recycling motor HelD [Scopulibacillus daqui]MBM7643818.1 DNA helicase-2/ATP-dependent DNA helicase PcrA [Scopulibacillus daqui]
MSKWEQEFKMEQKRVHQVTSKIDKHIDQLEEQAGVVKSDMSHIRKNFWDDVRINFDNPDEAAETYASIIQQAKLLSERERSHRHAEHQLDILKRLKQSPYFGRIDFLEDGEDEAECIYLGIGSFYDKENEEFLIYDWRAPISSLYYDYSLGRAEYNAPDSTITGTMELKRQFIIRDAKIKSMFDTGITIGDELLQEVLGNPSSSQMKSIVATIQKEQNQIIRNEKSRLLIVQGAAGSGKTSAALQRVAYLLYRYRDTLSADDIVLFSPNPLFNSYISTVLPELGEENMQQATFQEFLQSHLSESFDLEDPFTQMEHVLAAEGGADDDIRLKGIRYKAGLDFMEVIEQYLKYLGQKGLLFKNIKFRGEVIISQQQIANYFYKLDTSLPIPNRMKLVSERLLKELKNLAVKERSKPWVKEEIQFLDKEEYAHFYQLLRNKNQYTEDTFDDFEREEKLLSAYVVNEHFKKLRKQVKNLKFIDIQAIYRQLFSDPELAGTFVAKNKLPENWPEISRQTVSRLDNKILTYEDATPFLYLKERIEGFKTNTSVRHVFIDEAQDYSPFQFEFIKRLFPFSKMTVLGDMNQAIYAHAENTCLSMLSSLYGDEAADTIILKRSYRSTRPIVEFTRHLIEGGKDIIPFNRAGNKPVLNQAVNEEDLHLKLAGLIRDLKAQEQRTIAVICKTYKECQKAVKALQNEVPVRLIDKDTAAFETGILVIPSYLAKGVEFDAVIIYNASDEQYGKESERQLFYTACTRAMHELHLFFVGQPSRFISEVPENLYIQNKA